MRITTSRALKVSIKWKYFHVILAKSCCEENLALSFNALCRHATTSYKSTKVVEPRSTTFQTLCSSLAIHPSSYIGHRQLIPKENFFIRNLFFDLRRLIFVIKDSNSLKPLSY